MISRKYETVVGFFVVAALAALLIMVLIIAKQEGLWESYVEYQAVFTNISGLKRGSEVRLAGVSVGSVTNTAVRSDGKIVVTFQVAERYANQIREDSQASIGMIGLLGDRSLDLTAGTPDKPIVAPGGLVRAVDFLDLQELLARAAPSLESIQKAFDNLSKITDDMVDPKGDFKQAIVNIKDIARKINAGEGTLGLLVSDPKLYKDVLETVAGARKFVDSLNSSQGALGMILHDPATKADLDKIIKDISGMAANLQRGSRPLTESLAQLPAIVEKVQNFLANLDKAGVGLPDLVDTGQNVLSDADKVAEAAQKMWLLRRHIPKPKERTIKMERDVK
jgi:phospholipid/cholesterol/gamma-HCH transport system substrate-binding protein